VDHTGSLQTPISHTPLHAILLWGDRSKSPRVLIDSGADESFMDTTLVSDLGISTQLLSIPMDARALDGCSIGRVTHSTVPINLRVSGNHCESLQFLLISSPHTPFGFEIFMAPEAQPPDRLGYRFYPGLEPVLPRTLP
jgi:hypothetical protein